MIIAQISAIVKRNADGELQQRIFLSADAEGAGGKMQFILQDECGDIVGGNRVRFPKRTDVLPGDHVLLVQKALKFLDDRRGDGLAFDVVN